MKQLIKGSCLTVVGGLSSTALVIAISFHINHLGGWSDPPGKFILALEHTGASMLTFPLIISVIVFIWGLSCLLEEQMKPFYNWINK